MLFHASPLARLTLYLHEQGSSEVVGIVIPSELDLCCISLMKGHGKVFDACEVDGHDRPSSHLSHGCGGVRQDARAMMWKMHGQNPNTAPKVV